MRAVNLKTEYMIDPCGLDMKEPILSWQCSGGIKQSAYELYLACKDEVVYSAKEQTEDMQVRIAVPFTSRQCITWKVRLWDETGEVGPWSDTASFEMGLLDKSDWVATFIDPEPVVDQKKNPDRKGVRPASYLRKNFHIEKRDHARLYVTALGIYRAFLNGKPVGNFVLAPGPGNYHKNLCYQTYDVTDLLVEGNNEILIALGDGWCRSYSGVDGNFDLYSDRIALLCQLECGGKVACVSDGSWEASQDGPVRDNDLQQGEVYDAGMESISIWHGVKELDYDFSRLISGNTVPVVENESFPGRIITTPNGELVADFGQNLAGYISIRVNSEAGKKVVLTCGEALDENGNFTNLNFQPGDRHKAKEIRQQITYLCKAGYNFYKPSFTIMGFRYAKIETDVDVASLELTAHAVYSQMAQTAQFTCSDERINQLFQNAIWSMKSNFCHVPTDCPTRERAAWTGDAGVFVDTGLYLMNSVPVFRNWLRECRITQKKDGKVYNIAPPNNAISFISEMLSQSVGWGDASIIVPYALYKRTGDVRILEENFDMMAGWLSFLESRARRGSLRTLFQKNPYQKYTVETGMDYGEWCEPGVSPKEAMSQPIKSVGTAYLAYSSHLMVEICKILNRDESHYQMVSENAKKAYRHVFTRNGKIISDRQAEYVRALAFGLLEGKDAIQAADDLNQLVIKNNYHLNTGFLSTPYLCGILYQYGYGETAYRLLLQDTSPSWLYSVSKGATTIWETWDGIDERGIPHESLNHYSYGAVTGWLISGVCGICAEGKNIMITPCPNPMLRFAKATYQAPAGMIECGWEYDQDQIVYRIRIPENCTAQVHLPNREKQMLQPGYYEFS